jgi:hypothetical protein
MVSLLLADREMILYFFPRPRCAEGMLGQETYCPLVGFRSFVTLMIENIGDVHSSRISDATATDTAHRALPPSTTALINEYTIQLVNRGDDRKSITSTKTQRYRKERQKKDEENPQVRSKRSPIVPQTIRRTGTRRWISAPQGSVVRHRRCENNGAASNPFFLLQLPSDPGPKDSMRVEKQSQSSSSRRCVA